MPGQLDTAREAGRERAQKQKKEKSSTRFVPRHSDTSANRVYVASNPGHVDFKFVDVGGKFIEMGPAKHRVVQAERRREKAQAKKREAKRNSA